MDEGTRQRLDSVLEDELRWGYRIKKLPDDLEQLLLHDCGLVVSRVRFMRLNPAKRRKIAQVVQRQYHKDLQNPDILSHEQIMKLVQERGEWSAEMEKEMQELQTSTSREMGDLFVNGVAQDSWTQLLLEASAGFRAKVNAQLDQDTAVEVMARFDRWLEFTPEKQAYYNAHYASLQGKERYSADFDLQMLMGAVLDLEAVQYLNDIDDLRDRLQRYVRLQQQRLRLAELQVRQAKIFSDSVEQRRDNTEELARLYFTAERVDEDGKPEGPLCPEFDMIWEFPEAVVQWLLVEAYFFLNGIPDEAREYLQTFGFIAADAGETISPSGESEPSAESPAPLTSNPDSKPQEEMVAVSMGEPVATTSTMGS
jgi:hypothetical protein